MDSAAAQIAESLWIPEAPQQFSGALAGLTQNWLTGDDEQELREYLEKLFLGDSEAVGLAAEIARLSDTRWNSTRALSDAISVLKRKREISALVTALRDQIDRGQHNNPPERVDEVEQARELLAQADNLARDVQASLVQEDQKGLRDAASRGQALSTKVFRFAANKGNIFLDEASRSAGKASGPLIVGAAILTYRPAYQKLAELVQSMAAAISVISP